MPERSGRAGILSCRWGSGAGWHYGAGIPGALCMEGLSGRLPDQRRWLLSQKGLLKEWPQRQRVTRLRISYRIPFADSMGMPPRTHIGPCRPSWGYSTIPMDGSNTGSIAFFVVLSHTTRRPDGQFPASSMTVLFASRSFDRMVRSQIPPALSQNRADAQKMRASINCRSGPSISSEFSYVAQHL